MYDEYNCKGCSTLFKIFTSLVVLNIVFLISVSYVYLKEYYSTVKYTFNEINRTYTISSEFIALYTCASYSSLVFVAYVIFIGVMVCCMYVC